jgi:hypothetical protein
MSPIPFDEWKHKQDEWRVEDAIDDCDHIGCCISEGAMCVNSRRWGGVCPMVEAYNVRVCDDEERLSKWLA